MQWNTSQGAGFSTGEPWLPLGSDAEHRNVESQLGDPGSVLAGYREAIALRKKLPALRQGEMELMPPQGEVLSWLRRTPGETLCVALNMSAAAAGWESPGELLYSSQGREGGSLAPYEGRILKLERPPSSEEG